MIDLENTIPLVLAGEDFTYRIEGDGGKGGGGGGDSNQEDPITLRSDARASVMIAIGEGEIGGQFSDNFAKDIYFDKTPLMNANGTLNFQGVTWHLRVGTPDQSPVTGFTTSEALVNVSTQLHKDQGPIVRAVAAGNIDAARIIVTTPSLNIIDERGNQKGQSVEFDIEVMDSTNQVWESRGRQTISGRVTSPFQVAYRVARPAGTDRWLIRLTRVTDDSTSSKVMNDLFWDSFVEIEEDRNTYANTAYVALSVQISKFANSIPKMSFRVNGTKVRVPSNYDQSQIGVIGGQVYGNNGIWDGTFKRESTNNPIWHVMELLTNARFGMGIDDTFINIYDFYDISKYCDAVGDDGKYVGLPDGRGGDRPRFTLRTQLTSQAEAMSVIQSICSSMRAMSYWSAGQVQISLDRPKKRLHQLSNDNVVDGVFLYQGSSAADRATIANITYNNPDEFFEQDVTTFESEKGIQRYGRIVYDAVKTGCANEAEAQAFAKWAVDTAQTQTETVQCKVGPDNWSMRPGDLFSVSDSRYMGVKWSGRLRLSEEATYNPIPEYPEIEVKISGGMVVLDTPVTLTPGKKYWISQFVPIMATANLDGSRPNEQEHLIKKNSLLEFEVDASSITGAPVDRIKIKYYSGEEIVGGELFNHEFQYVGSVNPDTVWVIRGNDVAPRMFTCVTIAESGPYEYEVNGVIYDPGKFQRVEYNIDIPNVPSRKVSLTTTDRPSKLFFKQLTRIDQLTLLPRNDLEVSWFQVVSATTYRIRYSVNGGALSSPSDVTSPIMTFQNAEEGEWFVSVTAVNTAGVESLPVTGTYTVKYAQNPSGSGNGYTGNPGQPVTPPTVGDSELDAPTDLRIVGSSTTFFTPDAIFEWTPPDNLGGTVVKGWEVTISKDGVVRTREEVYPSGTTTYTYSYSANMGQGLTRTFGVQVRAIDSNGRFSQAVSETFTNPAPALAANPVVTPTATGVQLVHDEVFGFDFVSTVVWAGLEETFVPGIGNRYYDAAGSNGGTTHDVSTPAGVSGFLRYAVADSFSKDPSLLILSDPIPFAARSDLPSDPDPTSLQLLDTSSDGNIQIQAIVDEAPEGSFTSYEFELSEDEGATWITGPHSGFNGYLFTGLKQNFTYQVRYRVRDGVKASEWSEPVALLTTGTSDPEDTPNPAPEPTTNLVLVDTSDEGTVQVTATAPTFAGGSYSSYEFAFSTDAGATWTGNYLSGEPVMTFTGLMGETEYRFRYRMRLNSRFGSWSGVSTITTPAWASGGGSAEYPAFTGNAGKVLAVNAGATDVEWIAAPAPAYTTPSTTTFAPIVGSGNSGFLMFLQISAAASTPWPRTALEYQVSSVASFVGAQSIFTNKTTTINHVLNASAANWYVRYRGVNGDVVGGWSPTTIVAQPVPAVLPISEVLSLTTGVYGNLIGITASVNASDPTKPNSANTVVEWGISETALAQANPLWTQTTGSYQCQFLGLKPGTQYSVTQRRVHGFSRGPWKAVVNITTPNGPVAAPSFTTAIEAGEVTATATSTAGNTLVWGFASTSAKTDVQTYQGFGSEYVFRGLTAGTYYIKCRERDAVGLLGPWTTVQTVVVP